MSAVEPGGGASARAMLAGPARTRPPSTARRCDIIVTAHRRRRRQPWTCRRTDARTAPRYQSGFGNHFATEALPGALPRGAQLAAALRLRAVRRAVLRHRLHRAAPRQPPQLAVPHPAGRGARQLPRGRRRRASAAASTRSRPSPNRLRWDPLPLPRAPTDFVDGLVTLAGNGSPGRAQRLRHPLVRRQPLDAAGASSTTPTASC